MVYEFILTILGARGAILISEFNTVLKDKKELYGEARMSKDMRNSLFIWSSILAIGGIMSYLISQYMAISVFIV